MTTGRLERTITAGAVLLSACGANQWQPRSPHHDPPPRCGDSTWVAVSALVAAGLLGLVASDDSPDEHGLDETKEDVRLGAGIGAVGLGVLGVSIMASRWRCEDDQREWAARHVPPLSPSLR
jgi:hypothetical protein